MILDTSLSGLRVARELDRFMEERSKPVSLLETERHQWQTGELTPYRNIVMFL